MSDSTIKDSKKALYFVVKYDQPCWHEKKTFQLDQGKIEKVVTSYLPQPAVKLRSLYETGTLVCIYCTECNKEYPKASVLFKQWLNTPCDF